MIFWVGGLELSVMGPCFLERGVGGIGERTLLFIGGGWRLVGGGVFFWARGVVGRGSVS